MSGTLELLLYVAAFTSLQDVVRVPARAYLFRTLGTRGCSVRGGKLRLRGLVPFGRAILATRLPFRTGGEGLYCGDSMSRFRAETTRPGRWAGLDRIRSSTIDGGGVLVDGVRLVEATSPAEAEWLRALAVACAAPPEAPPDPSLEAILDRSLSSAAFEQRLKMVDEVVRPLSVMVTLYLAVVFGLLVSGQWIQFQLSTWFRAGVVMAPVHVGSVVALWFALRALAPNERGGRRYAVAEALLFPPALFAAPRRLYSNHVVGFHPVTAAAILLPDRSFRRVLRFELARLEFSSREWDRGDEREGPGQGTPVDGLSQLVRDRMWTFAREQGVDPANLLRDVVLDPLAASYCPICLSGFLHTGTKCPDCAVDLVRAREEPTSAS